MFMLSSEAISSDNCYGLPYQDHNYGSAMSPDMGNNRVSHSRGNHMQHAAPQLSRTRITVKTTPSSFPSLAGPPPLERNSCSDDENVVDPLLYAQTATTSPNFVSSPFVGSSSSAHSSGFKSVPTVTAMPPGGITVCSSAVARPRIKRMPMMEDGGSHSYASSLSASSDLGTHLSLVKPHVGATILPIGSSTNSSNHPQKVAVFRRFPGSSGTTIQVNGPNLSSLNCPPNLVSTSTTGAPTFSGSIVGPGLMAPIIAVTGVETLPPPKRPGRPRGARIGGQQPQRAPRQPKTKKSRQQTEFLTTPPIDHMLSTIRQVVMPSSIDIVSSPPPAAAHESVMPESMACLLSSDADISSNCIAEVAQSIENVLQSVSASTDLSTENSLIGQQSPQSSLSSAYSAARKKQPAAIAAAAAAANANMGETDFAETYKSLYDRLFKQLGVPDDEDIDLDRPVGASRAPFVRLTSPKKSPSFIAGRSSSQTSKPENQLAKESPSPKSVVGGSNTDTDESSDDEWAGQDYITRCVCQMTHNDDFMIQCDRCESWQHCDCVGLQKKYVPEHYLCELCDPRPLKLTKDEAQKLQMKKLQKRKRQKAARKRLSSSAGSVGRGRPRKNTGDSSTVVKPAKRNKQSEQDQADEDLYSTFMHMEVNEYTNEVMRAIRLCGSSVGASLLEQLPQPPPCLIMYVTKERRGLVANKTIPPDQPVMEFRGKISSALEFDGRNKSGRIYPCVLFYRGLSKGGGVDGLTPMDLCVDARYRGTEARFVRRSCQPNTQVKHVIKNDQLYLLLVSTELIESATELTIPFDYDYRLCNYEIECGCKIWGNKDCPLDRHNSQALVSPTVLSAATSPKKSVSIVTSSGSGVSQQKHRTTNSSSVKKATNFHRKKKILSGAKNAASKFSKKAVGFKVKLKDKINVRSKIGKYAKKKLKPVASADLTRRRSSAISDCNPVLSSPPSSPDPKVPKKEPKEEPIAEKHEDTRPLLSSPKPKSVSRTVSERGESSIRVSFSSAGDDLSSPDGHLLTREEKKMQQLVEQIARMEEREKRKVEKRSAKHLDETPLSSSVRTKSFSGPSGDGKKSPTIKNVKKRGRRPSANSLTARKRTTSLKSDQMLMSNSDRDSDSGGDATDNDDVKPVGSVIEICGSPRISLVEQPSVSFASNAETAAASVSSQRKSSAMDVERNVAKKRWLRQAMSEENVVAVSPTVETKQLSEICSTPPLSPPTAPPLKKRKLTSNQTDETEIINTSSMNDPIATSPDQVPLSTTEAAEELLALTQQQNVQINEMSEIFIKNEFKHVSADDATESASNLEQLAIFLETATAADDRSVVEQVERCGTPVQDEKEEDTILVDDATAQPSAAVVFPPLSTYDCVEFYSSSEQKSGFSNVWDDHKIDVQHQLPAPEPRKKVKMSLDEYKKRKRDVADGGVVIDFASSVDTSRDSSAESASAPVTPGSSTPSVQQRIAVAASSSFIPKIKEGDLEAKPVRLVNLPDPSLIGKNVATMEELRQRIYAHSFASKQQEPQPAPDNLDSNSGMDTIDSPEQIMESSSPEPSITNAETTDVESLAPSQHRMSLMDRLRMEFGLEDAAASAQSAAAAAAALTDHRQGPQPVPPPQQYNNVMANPALAMIQNVRNSFQPAPNFNPINQNANSAAYLRAPILVTEYRNFAPMINSGADHRPPSTLLNTIPTPVGQPPVEIQRMMSAMMGAMINNNLPRPPPPPPAFAGNYAVRREGGSGSSSSSVDDERDSRETSGRGSSADYRRNYFRRRSKSPSDYGRRRR